MMARKRKGNETLQMENEPLFEQCFNTTTKADAQPVDPICCYGRQAGEWVEGGWFSKRLDSTTLQSPNVG